MAYVVNNRGFGTFPVQFNLANGEVLSLSLQAPRMKVLTRFRGLNLESPEAIDALMDLLVDILNNHAPLLIHGLLS